MTQRVFRVFLSSTFSDFQEERDALRPIWKELEAWCGAQGASFQVVDLRWGISEEVAVNHDTIRICLDEIKRCQQLSPKPNFIVLTGNRYGWRPPAVTIPDTDWRQIISIVSDDDTAFLSSWYRRDDNAVPPVWRLRPREGEYVRFSVWHPAENHLSSLLQSVSARIGLAPESYCYSATHQEIFHGLLNYDGAQEHVFSFNRAITGLPETVIAGDLAGKYADYLADGAVDHAAKTFLALQKEQIRQSLPSEQIHHYTASWHGGAHTALTADHIAQLCIDVEASLRQVISRELQQLERQTPLDEELEGQKKFQEETGTVLLGRDQELREIEEFLKEESSPVPLIIHAAGGAGKSALMAHAVMTAHLDNPNLVYRFIGATPRSWSPHTFLEDLINQIAREYGQPSPELPYSIIKRGELLHNHLALATAEQPLTIFIDAIDQFSDITPVRSADLFPKQLPPHVKLVISVLDGKDHEQLAAHYPLSPTIGLKPLPPEICGRILDSLLAGRKLTSGQRKAILDKAADSGLPIWLVLTAPLARKLASYDAPPDLPGEVKMLTYRIIEEIGTRHGEALTTAALRYIKLARFGLSENELQEILWKDAEVTAEFDAAKNPDQPDVKELPPVIWSRLYAELDPYINEYMMDGQLLHRYFHRVFGEVADEMPEETRKVLHGRLADYFAGQKMYLESVGETGPVARSGQGGDGVQPNRRKLMEQAYHLVHAGRADEAKTLIADFDFAMAKCRLNRSDDLAEDFRLVNTHQTVTHDRNFRIWDSFIKSNAHILRRGAADWPAHKILLQLAIEHADDSPATIGAEHFLADGKCDWAWLRRERRVEHAWVDPCVAVLEGHTLTVNGAQFLQNGRVLSWAGDRTLRLWTREGEPLKIINKNARSVSDAQLLPNGRILSWSRSPDNSLRLWSSEGQLVKILEGHTNTVKNVLHLPDGRILTWSLDKTLRFWNSEGEFIKILEGHTDAAENVLHLPDGRILTWSLDKTLRLWSSEGELLKILEGHTDTVVKAQYLPDGTILSWSHGKTLRLWSSEGELLKILEGHTDTVVNAQYLPDGQILTWSRDKTLRLWIDKGEPLKTLEGHTDSIVGAQYLPNSRILSWSDDNTLRLWSREGKHLKVLEGHSNSIRETQLLSDGRILSWSHDALRLWSSEGESLQSLVGHTDRVNGVHVFPNDLILSWSLDNTLRLWTSEGKLLNILRGHTGYIVGTQLRSDSMILSWSDDGTLRLWSSEGEQLETLEGHTDDVCDTQLLPDGRILTWSRDNTLRLWSIEGKPLKTLEGHTSWVNGTQLIPDGRILSWSNNTLRLWSNEGEPLKILEGHTGFVNGTQLLPDGRILSWSRDNTLRLWRNTGEPLKTLGGHTGFICGVFSAQLLPDGRFLSSADDNMPRLWSHEGELLKILEGHTSSVRGTQLLPDGRILTWSNDNTLRLWSNEGELLKTLEGHTDCVFDAKLLPDGRLLSYSGDRTWRLWTRDGEQLKTFMQLRTLKSDPMVWDAYCAEEKQDAGVAGLMLSTFGYGAYISFRRRGSQFLFWHGQSYCNAKNLFIDGRAIVTQKTGQVCFLQTYIGNRRVSIDELGR